MGTAAVGRIAAAQNNPVGAGYANAARNGSAYSAPVSNEDPYKSTKDDERRSEAMKKAWDAYDGVFHGGDTQWPLRWKVGKEPNPNSVPNLCGPIVDTDTAWLMGQSVSIKAKVIADSERTLPEEAQQYLDAVWGTSSDDRSDDDKMGVLQELATNGAVCGNAFLKINAVVDMETKQLLDPEQYPEIVVLDSRHVRVRTDPHNVKLVICYIIEYPMSDPARPQDPQGMYRQVIGLVDPDGKETTDGSYASDDDATWKITEYFRAYNSKTFGPYVDETGKLHESEVWPFPWAPIDGCAHFVNPNRYYGRPHLTPDVIHLNEMIALVASNINKIIISHAHPVLFTVSPGSNLKAIEYEPGTILQVSSKIEAVQAHGDIANMLAVLKDLRADLDQVSRVPGQLFGRQDSIPRTAVSGVALRLGNGPVISDNTKERRTYGALVRRISQRLLCLVNADWKDAAVELSWQDPLPADDLQQAQVLQTLLAAGVISKREAATNLGVDWDKMQDEMTEEGQAKVNGMAQGTVVPMPPSAPQPGQPARQRPGQSPIAQPGSVLPPAGGAR